MEQITAYKASDGKLFNNVADCQDYEVSLIWRDKIDEFIKSGASPYTSGAHVSIVHRSIVAWENFKTKVDLNN